MESAKKPSHYVGSQGGGGVFPKSIFANFDYVNSIRGLLVVGDMN